MTSRLMSTEVFSAEGAEDAQRTQGRNGRAIGAQSFPLRPLRILSDLCAESFSSLVQFPSPLSSGRRRRGGAAIVSG